METLAQVVQEVEQDVLDFEGLLRAAEEDFHREFEANPDCGEVKFHYYMVYFRLTSEEDLTAPEVCEYARTHLRLQRSIYDGLSLRTSAMRGETLIMEDGVLGLCYVPELVARERRVEEFVLDYYMRTISTIHFVDLVDPHFSLADLISVDVSWPILETRAMERQSGRDTA